MSDEEIEKLKAEKAAKMMKSSLQHQFPIGEVVELTDSTFDSFIEQKGIIVVDFWAQWCGPCRSMAPILDQLAREWGSKGIQIGKVNVDQNNATAMKYRVSSIPMFLVFKDGEVLGNILGAIGKAPFDKLFKDLLDGKDPRKQEGYS